MHNAPVHSEKSGAPRSAPGREIPALLAGFSFFCLLCGYYILRPMRAEIAVQYGPEQVQWLFTLTFVCTLICVPIFGLVARYTPLKLLPPFVFAFFISNLIAFALLLDEQLGGPLAGALFVWLSVFNMLAVALFWSVVSDAFASDQARRDYGFVAAGGTAGTLVGPGLVALAGSGWSNAWLLGASAALLGVSGLVLTLLRARYAENPTAQSAPLGGSIFAGFRLALVRPPLRDILLIILCYSATATLLYVQLTESVKGEFPDPDERRRLFAAFDLAVSAATLGLQVFGARPVFTRLGLGAALTIAPALMFAGSLGAGLWSLVFVIVAVQFVLRTTEFALSKPAREVIYTNVDEESRYKAKNFIDTAAYRAGDAISAWAGAGLQALGSNILVFAAAPVAAIWFVIGLRAGRREDARAAEGRA